MNEPMVPGRSARPEAALVVVLFLTALVVTAGFLFHMPFGLGGWELAIMAVPLVAAAAVLAALLRMARRRV